MRSLLDYGDALSAGAVGVQMKRLQSLQNAAARLVSEVQRCATTSRQLHAASKGFRYVSELLSRVHICTNPASRWENVPWRPRLTFTSGCQDIAHSIAHLTEQFAVCSALSVNASKSAFKKKLKMYLLGQVTTNTVRCHVFLWFFTNVWTYLLIYLLTYLTTRCRTRRSIRCTACRQF